MSVLGQGYAHLQIKCAYLCSTEVINVVDSCVCVVFYAGACILITFVTQDSAHGCMEG